MRGREAGDGGGGETGRGRGGKWDGRTDHGVGYDLVLNHQVFHGGRVLFAHVSVVFVLVHAWFAVGADG